jgi:hypothetical protein
LPKKSMPSQRALTSPLIGHNSCMVNYLKKPMVPLNLLGRYYLKKFLHPKRRLKN